jgi:DNA-directed RNA polymerase subunit RPC12/RpoP
MERKCPVYRCHTCGRTFDEVEGKEGPELEEDGGPSFE